MNVETANPGNRLVVSVYQVKSRTLFQEGERHRSLALENSPPRRSNKRRERTFKDECLILFCKGLTRRTKVAGSHFSVSGDKRSTPGIVTRRKGRAGLTPGPQTQGGRVP